MKKGSKVIDFKLLVDRYKDKRKDYKGRRYIIELQLSRSSSAGEAPPYRRLILVVGIYIADIVDDVVVVLLFYDRRKFDLIIMLVDI